jgi:hypothetical protein
MSAFLGISHPSIYGSETAPKMRPPSPAIEQFFAVVRCVRPGSPGQG